MGAGCTKNTRPVSPTTASAHVMSWKQVIDRYLDVDKTKLKLAILACCHPIIRADCTFTNNNPGSAVGEEEEPWVILTYKGVTSIHTSTSGSMYGIILKPSFYHHHHQRPNREVEVAILAAKPCPGYTVYVCKTTSLSLLSDERSLFKYVKTRIQSATTTIPHTSMASGAHIERFFSMTRRVSY